MEIQTLTKQLRNSSRFNSLSQSQKEAIIARLYEAFDVGVKALILEQLDGVGDREIVHRLIRTDNERGLWQYAEKTIPHFQAKIEALTVELTTVFEEELVYGSRN